MEIKNAPPHATHIFHISKVFTWFVITERTHSRRSGIPPHIYKYWGKTETRRILPMHNFREFQRSWTPRRRFIDSVCFLLWIDWLSASFWPEEESLLAFRWGISLQSRLPMCPMGNSLPIAFPPFLSPDQRYNTNFSSPTSHLEMTFRMLCGLPSHLCCSSSVAETYRVF